jgi:hypothetical protein
MAAVIRGPGASVSSTGTARPAGPAGTRRVRPRRAGPLAVRGCRVQPADAGQFQAKSLDPVQRAVQRRLIQLAGQHGDRAIRHDVERCAI